MNRLSEKQMLNLINYIKLNRFKGSSRAQIAKDATKDLRHKVNANNILRAQKRAGLEPIQVGRPSKKDFIGPPKPKNLEVQVGGNHYSKMVIQPIEYILKNNLGYCEANVVKYISRWKDKGGVQDLEKAKHYIDMLIAQN